MVETKIKEVLRKLIEEQSEGEWDTKTIESDVEFFYSGLLEYFKDDS